MYQGTISPNYVTFIVILNGIPKDTSNSLQVI